MNVLLVAAKANSSRVPKKNFRPFFHGKSLVDLSLDMLSSFNSPKVIIGEGSGTINALMFGGSPTNFIGLQESESLSNKYFLEGGWPYTHLIAHKSRFLTGQVTQRSFNSPIQPASYSCSHLSHILNSML